MDQDAFETLALQERPSGLVSLNRGAILSSMKMTRGAEELKVGDNIALSAQAGYGSGGPLGTF